ncbi:MAG: tRNA dihydrouridine(20/20a) synthase DusA [Hyphomicrobiales bacterium]|nr:tRNA dihydrouridine(20/20a) synthase DusA [Hyphomicrobiales bacterium]MDE2113747.1 tRNA dihydrouridine(20/20a) synthase DusA [Hyphomicrobiales bacterium]
MTFSVAPMMDWTDRHCRYFHRLMTRHARLYTEMVTTGAILHGPRDRLLGFDAQEHKVAVQLGGNDPHDLAQCARICEDYGYDEINLNVGCPSDRVQNGAFGACLMREPTLVGECVQAMKASVKLPVTVKCRIGVDDQEPQQALWDMAQTMRDAGVDGLIVHARKAWLQGLSPKENRDVPPLDYGLVYQLKRAFPNLPIAINGGIADLPQTQAHLAHVDGVMMGRAAYHNPMLLLDVDPVLFGTPRPVADGFAALEAYYPYIERQLQQGVRLHSITRHLLGMFTGIAGARAFRRHLSGEGMREGAGLAVLRDAVKLVRPVLQAA